MKHQTENIILGGTVMESKIFTKFKLTFIMLLALIIVSACSDSTTNSSTGSEDSKSEEGSIKIGMTSALTGPYNEYGEGNKRAVELAIEKWNKDGGINGRKIELKALDDQLVPDKAAINMQELVGDEDIVAVIGPAGSGPALATVPITEAEGMVHINAIPQTVEVVLSGRFKSAS